jgi:hypothetical protein
LNQTNLSLILLVITFTPFHFPQQSSLSKAVNYISSYIASNEFVDLKERIGDLPAIDSIYIKALEYKKYDYSEALLSLTFATLPYKEVPVRIPLINSIWKFPLFAAEDSIYQLKNKNLPKNLFYDTPPGDFGDKDKLAHFFGTAFWSYNRLFFDLTFVIGYFVEAFEESFQVQNVIDERDLEANYFGNIFGKLLQNDKSIFPSEVLVMRSIFYFGNPF